MKHLLLAYQHYKASVKDELRKLGCDGLKFDEFYQESFFVLMEKHESGIKKKYNRSYIIQMCKHLWFKERMRLNIHLSFEETDPVQHHDNLFTIETMVSLLKKHMNLLSDSCREILTLYSLDYSEKKIGRILKLENIKKVKNRKYYCLDKLHKNIINDPLYNEIHE